MLSFHWYLRFHENMFVSYKCFYHHQFTKQPCKTQCEFQVVEHFILLTIYLTFRLYSDTIKMRRELFLKKRTVYRLTWLSRLILTGIFAMIFFILVHYIPIFLSVNKPVNGKILVLDGQIPDYVIQDAIQLFESGHYQYIVTTGSNLPEGFYLSEMKTMAELSRATFLALGFDSTKVVAIPTKFVTRNRTFNSANTFNDWLISNHPEITSIDVLAVGCHSRRSWFLFKKALGQQINVGIISIPHQGYDLKRWWKSSIGSRNVISETIAYIFVLVNT